MGNKHSHRRANSFIGENVGGGGNKHGSNKRHSMKEDSSNGNETQLSEQQQGNKSPETTPSLSLDKLQFNQQKETFRTDSNNSSSSSKRKSLPTNLKIGTPTPKMDSPATEKFWFLLNTPPQHLQHSNIDSNIFEKPSSLDINSHSSSLTGPRSSIFDEYISGITMDVISATSPAIDVDGLSNNVKKERKASPSAFQAITNYKNKKNSIINHSNNEKETKRSASSVSNIQPSIPKYLEEEKIDFSQPLITPRYVKDSSIGLSDSVDASISHLKHLISDDFVETRRNNLAVQSSKELNPPDSNDSSPLLIDTLVNNSPNINNSSSRNIPPLKLKQVSNVNSPSGGALSAHSTPKNSPLPTAIPVSTEVNSDASTVTGATHRSTRSLPWFISPKSPTQDSENNSPPPPPNQNNNSKRKSRTSVSDIKGGDIDSLREEIRKFESQTPQNEENDLNQEPPTKYWDEIEEEEQDRKRKSLNAIYENFEHLQNIDVVIPRGSAKLSASSSGFLNNKRASMTLTSVICGTDLQGSSDYIKNQKRSSVNLSNIIFTDKNGEQTIVTPEASGALFGRGDSVANIDVASDRQRANRRLSLRQSLTQSFNEKRRSATAFLNSKLFKL
ncbi:Hypothetical protein NAEGRDRAFT_59388 [Naegleria gruberi]|uniref:Uncharacterized protein n=1 Tax=Naegleria gruberi TaxID=5762 RepID=D2VW71_NAEGR|nr:uncharacterized protein NAEGRDRAFT_59388 [Naegleria gruberi]EFC39028.1 Hypothetical protein NAEGRDRAFT_59388 [Naegleria gruberi]|eukprot:XP_002671772.1 Hypothetical protein NAEGRDRAFT_59388 [Naegleria gruberi strain NEG-M]